MVPKSIIGILYIMASFTIFLIIYLAQQRQNWWYYDYEIQRANEKYRTNTSGRKVQNKAMECQLPEMDPWHPDIVPFLDPNSTSFRDCNRSISQITQLRNGRVELTDQWRLRKPLCQFRCLTLHNEHELNLGQWLDIDLSKPDCDVVEVRCKQPNSMQYTTDVSGQNEKDLWVHDLHIQIVDSSSPLSNLPNSTSMAIEAQLPDVHVLVFDSISHPHMVRAMPKTVAFLKDQMEAEPFPFLNRVGLNSRPNGYAIFFGIQVTRVVSSVFGSGYLPERDREALSGSFLDNESFVGFEFRAKNYRTLMAEATADGAFTTWPTGKGFRQKPTDHYLRPLYLALHKNPEFKNKKFFKKSCKEPFRFMLDYLQQFLDIGRNESTDRRPQFSISWINEETHNSQNGLYRLDQPISEFLHKNQQKLDNAFVFVMADHGYRLGSVSTTAQGQLETNNPALFVVVPKKLRADLQLMQALHANSARILSHFDVHATMVDIARHGNHFDSPFSTRFGQSILHPFKETIARNCDSLKIPLEFCNCQMKRRNITKNESGQSLGELVGKAMVKRMNAELERQKIDSKCAKLEMKEDDFEVIEVEADRIGNIYQVTIRTRPGNGHFWTFVKLQDHDLDSPEVTFLNDPFERMDKYGEQAKCALDSPAALYCYCVEKSNF